VVRGAGPNERPVGEAGETVKNAKSRSRTKVGPRRPTAAARPRSAAAPAGVRSSRPLAPRTESGRTSLPRSAPLSLESMNGEELAVATLDAALAGISSHRSDALRSDPSRMAPRFPEDDYDYSYLHDFLALDYVPRDCRAVVFGCGKGEEAVFFSERGYRVTGIDSDRSSIGLARERAWLNAREIDFMIGDVFDSANLLPAESFGLASDRGVFRRIKGERERRRYLDLLRRLLLPGGVFLLAATEVDLGKKVKVARKRKKKQDDLLVLEGGEVMGEVIRAGLTISGRKHYPVPGQDGKAELLLYCQR